jgi:hypothetical protein
MACNNCNETQDPNCGCTTEALHINQICNPIVCPSDECAESFSAACIRYTGADLVCDNITIVETDTNVAQALSNIISFICASDTVTVNADILCDQDIVVPEGTLLNSALELVVTYFCEQVENLELAIDNIDFPVDAIVGGTGITVTSNTVGAVTTFTIINNDSGSAVTLNSAGGTSLVFDGTGPTLSTKGLTAGSGILIGAAATQISITNSAPDQTVVLNEGAGIDITGTYPNFTVTNTDLGSAVTLGSVGAGESIVNDGIGSALATKSITAGSGIAVTSSATEIQITNTSPVPPAATNYGLFAQTANSTIITNTTAESSLINGGVGTLTIPANGFSVGDSFRAVFGGVMNADNNQNIRIKVEAGSIVLLDSGPQNLGSSVINDVWSLNIDFTIRAIGAAGVASIVSLASFHYTKTNNASVQGFGFNTVNNTTFDTTISNVLNVTAQWGTASSGNNIYSDIFILNKIY